MCSIIDKRKTDLRTVYTDGQTIILLLWWNIIIIMASNETELWSVEKIHVGSLWESFSWKNLYSHLVCSQQTANISSCLHRKNNILVTCGLGLFMSTMCCREGSKETLCLLCETLYRVDADVLFVAALHLIHYTQHAREIAEGIYSKGPRQSLLHRWTFCELGSAARSMHQIKNVSSLLWPVFHTDCCYQHNCHPHVSIWPSDACLSLVLSEKERQEF